MAIADMRATAVAMPLEAPLRHAHGAHWGRFIHTIVEVIDEDGQSGFGELGGGGASAEQAAMSLLPYLRGHDLLQLEQLRWKITNSVGSLYNNRLQVHAAIEMACIDLAGKKLGVRACDLLGGAIRYDRDPERPDWYATLPETRFVDPALKSAPAIFGGADRGSPKET